MVLGDGLLLRDIMTGGHRNIISNRVCSHYSLPVASERIQLYLCGKHVHVKRAKSEVLVESPSSFQAVGCKV